MKLEATGKPFIYRWPGGEVRLESGKPIDLPPDRAAKLLARASGRVRQVEPPDPTVIEFASPIAKAIYWERGDTSISGPATPLFLEQVGHDSVLVVEYRGDLISINANTLRSKHQFETQVKLRVVEPVKECR
ncbi:MAG: hypothetical protein CV088_17580 [Nitrospira sp. LK70]|nr:hypothetical protein [Nitrospira sp. LK70]